jgi:hypothetical protein
MKGAELLNWIALVWSILSGISLLQDPDTDFWSYVYMGVLIAAQVTALKNI